MLPHVQLLSSRCEDRVGFVARRRPSAEPASQVLSCAWSAGGCDKYALVHLQASFIMPDASDAVGQACRKAGHLTAGNDRTEDGYILDPRLRHLRLQR